MRQKSPGWLISWETGQGQNHASALNQLISTTSSPSTLTIWSLGFTLSFPHPWRRADRGRSWSTVESLDSVDSAESIESAESFGLNPLNVGLQKFELHDFCPGTERGDEITPDMPSQSQRSPSPGNNPIGSDQELLDDDYGESIFSAGESAYEGSIWMSDYSDSIPVLEEGHSLLLIKPVVAQELFLAFQRWQHRQCGSFDNLPPGDSPTASGSGRSDTSPRKRQRGNGGGEDGKKVVMTRELLKNDLNLSRRVLSINLLSRVHLPRKIPQSIENAIATN
jgi:hypothetical protein